MYSYFVNYVMSNDLHLVKK